MLDSTKTLYSQRRVYALQKFDEVTLRRNEVKLAELNAQGARLIGYEVATLAGFLAEGRVHPCDEGHCEPGLNEAFIAMLDAAWAMPAGPKRNWALALLLAVGGAAE